MTVRGKKILVTGGAGFIGSHIVDSLLKEDARQIVVLDIFHGKIPLNLRHHRFEKRLQVHNGDIRDRGLVHELTRGVDYILHQASLRLNKCQENPRLCQEVVVDGTFNILEAAAENKAKKVILASSASVYGEPLYTPMDEKHPYNNHTVYGAAKIANEQMAIAFHDRYSIPIIVLRYFNAYGPRMDIAGVYTEIFLKWLEKIEKNESFAIPSSAQSLDFVYVEDIASANLSALKSDTRFGIYNVGTGKSTSFKQLAKLILEVTNSKVTPIIQSDVKRPHVQKRQAEIKKIQEEIGFTSKVTVKEGLKRLVNWRKELLGSIV